MLELNTDMISPSPERRMAIIRKHLQIGIPIDYDRLYEYVGHFTLEAEQLSSALNDEVGMKFSKDGFVGINEFTAWCNSNGITVGFDHTARGAISFNKQSIENFLNTNYYGDDVNVIVKAFAKCRNALKMIDFIPNLIKAFPASNMHSADGRRIGFIRPNIAPQNTGRFGYVDPAVQNFPSFMKDLVCAPAGWHIVTADSGQIEPKIIYGFFLQDPQIQKLIEVYGDAYYAVLHYCTMDKSMLGTTMDFTAKPITDEMAANRKRLKTYGNAVMYGSTSNPSKDPLKQAYIERIGNNPKRLAWAADLERRIYAGEHIFKSVFGTPIDIYKSDKYVKASSDRERLIALLHCAVNNPVQGTAADLMGFSLDASDKLLSRKAPNSWIVKFIHDEGQYCIHENDMDAVIDEIKGHTSYSIDGGRVVIFNDPHVDRELRKDIAPTFLD